MNETTTLPRQATTPDTLELRVYYEDTDAAGVVYYANYLRFCERARTEWLRTRGFGQQVLMREHATAFVVTEIAARYRAPARLDDLLRIETSAARIRGTRIEFAQKVLRNEELLFDSLITVGCIDTSKQKPAPLPFKLRSRLKETPPT